jgi:4-amino-4-deoxy-L-arabinose transferase-like glycosyltransferase
MNLGASVRRLPPHVIALFVLLVLAILLRTWFVLSYRPAFVGYPDARAYLVAAHEALYFNQFKPVGYPLFLQLLHAIDDRLTFVTIVQHLLGLGTAVLLYAATVRHVRRAWLALLPAVVVLFGGSQVFLEHAVLSDAPFTFVLAVALWCALRGVDTDRRVWWLAAVGAALAVSATLRTVGMFLIPIAAVWVLTRPRLSSRQRAVQAAAVLVPAALVLLIYLVPQHAQTGSWGLTRTTGFTFYARMAPLADCSRFTPPRGTEGLCEHRKPADRPNANWYIFSADPPAYRLYGVPPYPLTDAEPAAYRWRGEAPTRRFATAALLHQPLDYAASVVEGLANYVVPRTGRASVLEYDHLTLIRELHNRRVEDLALPDITAYYASGDGYLRRHVAALDRYGRWAKSEGFVIALLSLLALAGWLLARGPARDAAALFAGSGFALAVLPIAILFYDARYATPVVAALGAGAAIGADRLTDVLVPWVRRQRSGRGAR